MSKLYWVTWLTSLSGWLLVFHQSIASMIAVWSQSKTYEHGFLIVPIAIWAAWQSRKALSPELLKPAWQPGAMLIAPCFLWIVGYVAGVALFEHVAAIVSLQLLIWASLGHRLAKTFQFPILYLVFCIPFGDELIPYLQSVTADISVFAVRLSGIPIYRDGLYLTIPNGQFEVAEACSGIRFLISSIALGALFAHIFFKRLWKKIVFMLFSALFPILANGIRAYGIILVGHLSDMTIATGADHLIYGWAFFAFVTLIIFYIASKFSDKKQEAEIPVTSSSFKPFSAANAYLTSGIFAIFLFSYVWADSIDRREVKVEEPILIHSTISKNYRSDWGISFPASSRQIHAQLPDKGAELFAARYALNQKNAELISSSNQLFDNRLWTIKNRFNASLGTEGHDSIKVTGIEVVNNSGDMKRIIYWYCINDYCSNSKLKLKLQKAYQLISGKGGYAQVSALSSNQLSKSELLALAKQWISTK